MWPPERPTLCSPARGCQAFPFASDAGTLRGTERADDRDRTYLDLLIAVDDHLRSLARGERLFEEGQGGAEMYVVREGRFELSSGGRLLERIGPGGMIGEMALIDPAPRSATAVAVEASAVTVVNAWRFGELVKKVPGLALEMMRIMARRLRQANVASRARGGRPGGRRKPQASPKRRTPRARRPRR